MSFIGSTGDLGIATNIGRYPSEPEHLENYRLEALRNRFNISAFRDHVFYRENVQQEIETQNGIVYSRDPEYKQALRDLISSIFLVHEPLR